MNSSANVRSIAALEDLRNGLMRFKGEAQGALLVADREINRTRAWLQERLTYWQFELKRRRRMLEEAQLAMSACLRSGTRDHPPDCREPQALVERAQHLIQEAELELRTVQEHIKKVEQAVDSYQQQARRLIGTLEDELLKGAALLSNSTSILRSYVDGSSGGGTFLTTYTSSSQANTNVPSLTTNKAGRTDIQMISVADIDLSDSHVKGTSDFNKGISPDDVKEGWCKLQSVVAPAVVQGADADYFAQLDASQGLDNANGYLHIYQVFYGENSCIRLDKVGNKYTVVNGYHRLFIAQQLGITTVPAWVYSNLP
jgi:hypothetical protein